MNTAIVASATISAVATVVICFVTCLNYRMYQKIQAKHDEEQQRFGDLMEAMVIATLLSGPSGYGDYSNCKKNFSGEYKGETKIFK
jgi:hypothetical protein